MKLKDKFMNRMKVSFLYDSKNNMLELKDSDKSFYVFNNSDTQETNVLFRLRDGNFGILEPEK